MPTAAVDINKTETKRAIGIFNKLRLPDVPDTPTLEFASGEWFREIVGVFLGAIDKGTKARVIRELFLLAAKKSSKTSYGAAMMLTALIMNSRPRAEFLLIAPTQAIAELAFAQATGMASLDDDGFLQKRLHVQDHLKCITDRKTRAHLKIKTFDTSVLTGVKPAGVLIDELHEIARNAKASRIIGQIRGGLLPIPEAFLAFITTQSDEPPAGAFRAELMMARAIRDGRAQGAMMPILYEFPPAIMEDKNNPPAWQNSTHWPMVTPNLGRSVTIDRLKDEFETAKLKGEEEIRRWASQHLNIEIGLALQSDRWAGADWWQGATDKTLTLDSLIERSEVVIVGIDGGGLDDMLGLAVLGREKDTRRWLLWSHAWVHSCVLERRKEIAPRLRDFERDDDLTIIEDDSDQDVREVADIVEKIAEAGLLPDKNAIGVDPVGIHAIVDELELRGIAQAGENGAIVGVKQGWTLANAIKTAERRLAARDLLHANQAMMAWCIGNCKVEPRGNAITITKQAAGTAKIDPVMGMFNSVSLMAMNPATDTIYADERELRFARFA